MTAMAKAEQKAEIRQMVQARHDRQVARGETPVDVDVEVDRLLAQGAEMEPDPPPSTTTCCARRSASWWSPATSAA